MVGGRTRPSVRLGRQSLSVPSWPVGNKLFVLACHPCPDRPVVWAITAPARHRSGQAVVELLWAWHRPVVSAAALYFWIAQQTADAAVCC